MRRESGVSGSARRPDGARRRRRPSTAVELRVLSSTEETKRSLARVKEELEQEILLIQSLRLWRTCPTVGLPGSWTPDIFPSPCVMYKLAAAVDSKLVSVYDDDTEYWLGRKTASKRGAFGWPPLDSCFFVFKSPLEASRAKFPRDSKNAHRPKVLMKVIVSGNCYRHSSGRMWACKELVPTYFFRDIKYPLT